MPNYLCMQRSLPGGADSGEKPSPTQMQEMYAQFKDWSEKFKENLVDMGGRWFLAAVRPAARSTTGRPRLELPNTP